MKMRLKNLAAIVSTALVLGGASPAMAIDLHNCTSVNLKVKFYNGFDPVDLIAKRRINLSAGASRTGILVPGIGTDKVKIYNQSAGGQLVSTFNKVNSRLSYVLFINSNGTLGMLTGTGCTGPVGQ